MSTEMVSAIEETARPRGILSSADREFLLLTPEERKDNYSRQGRAKRRRKIRERTREAIYDCSLLLDFWTEDERSEVFDELLEEWRGREGLSDVIALLALELVPRDRFDDLFGRGILRAEHRRDTDQEPGLIRVRSYDEIVHVLDKATIEEAIVKYALGDRGIWDMSDAETRALTQLFEYEEFDESTFRSLLTNIDRAMYDLAGGPDSEARSNWRRSLHRQRNRDA